MYCSSIAVLVYMYKYVCIVTIPERERQESRENLLSCLARRLTVLGHIQYGGKTVPSPRNILQNTRAKSLLVSTVLCSKSMYMNI